MLTSNRRGFVRALAGAVGSAPLAVAASTSNEVPPLTVRQVQALDIRTMAAAYQASQTVPPQTSNGDETNFPNYVGCYTKGLPHNQSGEVDSTAYQTVLRAVSSGLPSDFQNIDRGSGMKLSDPEAAFAFEMVGLDSHCLACPAPPSVASAEGASEMVELYWHALARDTAFGDYLTSPTIAAASQELTKLSAFTGPRDSTGAVSSNTLFRMNFPGALDGPYISQFLWKPVPLNSTWMNQLWRVPASGVDFLNDYSEWLVIQNGLPPFRSQSFDPTARYIYNGRGLAEWVHYDFLYQAFHFAALILLNQTPEAILNTNPYYNPTNPYKTSKIESGFSTFGGPHICGLLGQVTIAALHAAWYQKWCVHRRLRPEEFGGLVHQKLANGAAYPISTGLLNSAAVANVFGTNGNYLLPQVFPEGAPMHPAYPSGHASVSGACSVILKAFFDETQLVDECVVPTADGTGLSPYTDTSLTVGGELNKLAANVAIGRNFAGIHYRSDALAGIKLGEQVAIGILKDLTMTYSESFGGFHFTLTDGTPVQITREASVPIGIRRPCVSVFPTPN